MKPIKRDLRTDKEHRFIPERHPTLAEYLSSGRVKIENSAYIIQGDDGIWVACGSVGFNVDATEEYLKDVKYGRIKP